MTSQGLFSVIVSEIQINKLRKHQKHMNFIMKFENKFFKFPMKLEMLSTHAFDTGIDIIYCTGLKQIGVLC